MKTTISKAWDMFRLIRNGGPALCNIAVTNSCNVSFFGGEPLLHPRLPEMIVIAAERDMGTDLITNGWLLPKLVDKLAAAGLKTVYISIDAATALDHETNRGLGGVCNRIRAATSRIPELGMTAIAQSDHEQVD